MTEFLRAVSAEYDIVLIDTPPVLPVTDSAIVAGQADGVLLVYQAGKVGRLVLKRAKAHLESTRAKVWGVVLNDVQTEVSGYNYTHYYTHYYGEETRVAARPRGRCSACGTRFARAWAVAAAPPRPPPRPHPRWTPRRAPRSAERRRQPPSGSARSRRRPRYRNAWVGVAVVGGLFGVLAVVAGWQLGVFDRGGHPLATLRQRLGIGPGTSAPTRPPTPVKPPGMPPTPTAPVTPSATAQAPSTKPEAPPSTPSANPPASTPTPSVSPSPAPAPPAPSAPSGPAPVTPPRTPSPPSRPAPVKPPTPSVVTSPTASRQVGAAVSRRRAPRRRPAALRDRVRSVRDGGGRRARRASAHPGRLSDRTLPPADGRRTLRGAARADPERPGRRRRSSTTLREQGFAEASVIVPRPADRARGRALAAAGAVEVAETLRARRAIRCGWPLSRAKQSAYVIRHGNFAVRDGSGGEGRRARSSRPAAPGDPGPVDRRCDWDHPARSARRPLGNIVVLGVAMVAASYALSHGLTSVSFTFAAGVLFALTMFGLVFLRSDFGHLPRHRSRCCCRRSSAPAAPAASRAPQHHRCAPRTSSSSSIGLSWLAKTAVNKELGLDRQDAAEPADPALRDRHRRWPRCIGYLHRHGEDSVRLLLRPQVRRVLRRLLHGRQQPARPPPRVAAGGGGVRHRGHREPGRASPRSPRATGCRRRSRARSASPTPSAATCSS